MWETKYLLLLSSQNVFLYFVLCCTFWATVLLHVCIYTGVAAFRGGNVSTRCFLCVLYWWLCWKSLQSKTDLVRFVLSLHVSSICCMTMYNLPCSSKKKFRVTENCPIWKGHARKRLSKFVSALLLCFSEMFRATESCPIWKGHARKRLSKFVSPLTMFFINVSCNWKLSHLEMARQETFV
jgi:hypothetical protein